MAKKNTANHDRARAGESSYEMLLAEETFILDVQMKIQAILNSREMTQVDLARKLKVSESYVSQMFGSSARNLTLRTVARILNVLELVPSISTRGIDDEETDLTVNNHRTSSVDRASWGEVVQISRGKSRTDRGFSPASKWAEYDLSLPEPLAVAA